MDRNGEHRDLESNRARLFGRYWLPVISYAGLIFYLSSLPHPEETMPVFLEAVGDKGLHMIEYGLFGLLSYRAFRYAAGPWATRYALPLAIGVSVLYGFTDELHQAFVPEREAEVWDLLADAAGASLVTWAWHRLTPLIGGERVSGAA